MGKDNSPRVLVIGGANVDLRGRPQAPFIPGTSNPGTVHRHPGGVGRNIATNLARLGVEVVFLSAVGDDEPGRYLLERTAAAGVDVSRVLVIPQQPTAAYLAMLDENGSLVAAISDMRILENLTPEYIEGHRDEIERAQAVLFDANLSPQAMASAVSLARGSKKFLAAAAVSRPKAPRLIPHLSSLDLLFCNKSEAEVLAEAMIGGVSEAVEVATKLVGTGVGFCVITVGEKGAAYATAEESGHNPARPAVVADTTGAGDALAAAVLFGFLIRLSIGEALNLGLVAAHLTVQTPETTSPELSLKRLQEMVREVAQDEKRRGDDSA